MTSTTREPLWRRSVGRSTLCAAGGPRQAGAPDRAATVRDLERGGDGTRRAELHLCDRMAGRARRDGELRGRRPLLERRDRGQRGAEGEEHQPQAAEEQLGSLRDGSCPAAGWTRRGRAGQRRARGPNVAAGSSPSVSTADATAQEPGDVVEMAGPGGQLGQVLNPAVRLVGVLGHQLGLVAGAVGHQSDEVGRTRSCARAAAARPTARTAARRRAATWPSSPASAARSMASLNETSLQLGPGGQAGDATCRRCHASGG